MKVKTNATQVKVNLQETKTDKAETQSINPSDLDDEFDLDIRARELKIQTGIRAGINTRYPGTTLAQ